MSIEVAHLSKSYKHNIALNSVSFKIADNSITAFLGPNGAGKSTTLKILAGFLSGDSGEVKINGYDIVKNSREVRQTIGYLPENNPLYQEMYVKEYLEYVGGMYHLSGRSLKSAVSEVIEKTGLEVEASKKIGRLSKGYKQRVGLAQAIIHNPSVLLLDEPTTRLDPNQLTEIRNLIKELGKGKSILFSTHNLYEAAFLCEHIIILNKGVIVEDRFFDQNADTTMLEDIFVNVTTKN